MTSTVSGPSQISNWPCCFFGPDPVLIQRASLWAAMHSLPSSHVVSSLALATCTSRRMTALTLAFRQFKAAQLLRLAEKSGSKTLGNTWYVSYPYFQLSRSSWVNAFGTIAVPCFPPSTRRGIRIPMPRPDYWFGSGRLDPCAAASSATTFRACLTLPQHSARTTKIQEAGTAMS